MRYLETKFEEVKSKEITLLESLPIKFTEPIVPFKEFADRIGVSTEAARAFLTANPPSGYIAIADILIGNKKLQQIDAKIKENISRSGKLPLKEAARIIEEEGVDDPANVLAALSYKIRWRGIDSNQAQVEPSR